MIYTVRKFVTISCGIILRMRKVSDNSCWGKSKHTFWFFFFFFKLYHLWNRVNKFGTAREATHGTRIQRRKGVICTHDNLDKYAAQIRNIQYSPLRKLLISPDFVQCFTAALAKTEELCSHLSISKICLARLHVERRPRVNEHSYVSK